MDSTYLPIARLDDLVEDVPAHAAADGIDLVLVRRGGTCTSSRGAARIAVLSWPTGGWRAPT